MSSEAPPLPFGILGPLLVGGVAGAGQQGRAAGVLLLERGAIVPATDLARWVLGADRAHDAPQVQVLVSRLRRLLRERAPAGVITSVAGGYRLEVDPADVDAGRFEALVREAGERVHEDPAGARALVDGALGLWRGEVLEGLGLDHHPAAARLLERRASSVELGFMLDLALGRLDTLPDLLVACRRQPQRERLAVLAMAALFLAGRQTEALALYQEARHQLVARAGVEPGAALRAAEAAILRHDVDGLLGAALDLRATARPGHRSSAPSPTPAVPPEEARLTGLPRFATSFVGRVELVERTATWAAVTPGLTTLVGPGGVGKTRLACEALSRIRSDRRQVWFCPVATLLDDAGGAGPASAPATGAGDDPSGGGPGVHDSLARLVARCVGARIEPGRSALDAVASALEAADGVLVLDSCEAQPGQAAELADRLRGTCPRLTILATSRSILGMRGERISPVPPLGRAGEAAELYCHRAIDADPGFAVGDDLEAIIELCDRLDGLPLAIELAAARSRTIGPRELLSYFDDRAVLDLLEADAADSTAPAERHRSLGATIDWSYRLLDPAQQRLLRRLSAFTGPVGIDDLAAVCGDDPDRRGLLAQRLATLVDRSMVAATRRDSVTRYRLLDTIRAFALERAAVERELDELRDLHARHYAAVLDGLRPALRGPEEAAAVARLDEVWPELRAAVGWALRAGCPELAVRLVAGLGFEAVFRERGEVVAWAERALALPNVEDEPGADELLGTAGLAGWGYGRFDEGLAWAERAVELHRRRGTRLTPDVAAALPLHHAWRGDLAGALAMMRAHGAEAARDGSAFARAFSEICEAMGRAFAGAPDEQVLLGAEELAARLACPLLRATAAFARTVFVYDRRPEEAVGHARRCLDLAASVGASWFLTTGTNYLVAALARSGAPDEALTLLLGGLERQRNGGTVQSVANTIRNAVVLLDRSGRAERAVPLIGWLEVNRPSIPGTPGMRDHPGVLGRELRARLGDAAYETQRLRGAGATTAEVIDLALRELTELFEPGPFGVAAG